MRLLSVLLVSVFCCSFCPTIEKESKNEGNGYYVFVEDFVDGTNHKYIVESKDSVNHIFKLFFQSELELGKVDRPISIYNGKLSLYVARVNVFEKSNGKKNFRHLKYPDLSHEKRARLKPVIL